MAKQTKAQKARTGVTQDLLPFADAIKLVKDNAKAKFDESIEIAVNLVTLIYGHLLRMVEMLRRR